MYFGQYSFLGYNKLTLVFFLLFGFSLFVSADKNNSAVCEELLVAGKTKEFNKLLKKVPNKSLFKVKRSCWNTTDPTKLLQVCDTVDGIEKLIYLNWSIYLLCKENQYGLAKSTHVRYELALKKLSPGDRPTLATYVYKNYLKLPKKSKNKKAADLRFLQAQNYYKVLRFNDAKRIFTDLLKEKYKVEECIAYIKCCEVEQSPTAYRNALSLLKKLKSPKAIAILNAAIGNHYLFNDLEFRYAAKYFKEALKADDPDLGKVLRVPLHLGIISQYSRRYTDAVKYYSLDKVYSGEIGELIRHYCEKKISPLHKHSSLREVSATRGLYIACVYLETLTFERADSLFQKVINKKFSGTTKNHIQYAIIELAQSNLINQKKSALDTEKENSLILKLNEALKLNGIYNSLALYELVRIYHQRPKEYTKAWELEDEIIKRYPISNEAKSLLFGRIYESLFAPDLSEIDPSIKKVKADYEKALKQIDIYVKRFPNDVNVTKLLNMKKEIIELEKQKK